MATKIILHLTGMDSTKYGALETYFFELAKACNEKNFHTVIQYETPPKSEEYIKDLKKIDVEIKIKPVNRNYPVKSILNALQLIHTIKPDIIHIHRVNRDIVLIVPILSKIFDVKKILYMKHGYPGLKQNSFQRFLYNQYDHILAVSESIAKNLLSAGIKSNKISIHYLGLFGERKISRQLKSEIRKKFKIPDQATVLGCIAFDDPLKGVNFLLKALAKVVEKNPNVHLLQIGIDPKLSKLPDLVEKLNLSSNVHWAGICNNGWQILNAADIYIQPSLSEGLGLAILEAMALKLPIIATNIGGIPEIVTHGENGYLAQPASVNSLTTVLNQILANPSQWEIMGNISYNKYQQFITGEESVKKLVKNYYSTE